MYNQKQAIQSLILQGQQQSNGDLVFRHTTYFSRTKKFAEQNQHKINNWHFSSSPENFSIKRLSLDEKQTKSFLKLNHNMENNRQKQLNPIVIIQARYQNMKKINDPARNKFLMDMQQEIQFLRLNRYPRQLSSYKKQIPRVNISNFEFRKSNSKLMPQQIADKLENLKYQTFLKKMYPKQVDQKNELREQKQQNKKLFRLAPKSFRGKKLKFQPIKKKYLAC